MATQVAVTGPYEMNFATGKMELMKEAPELVKGQKLYLGAKNSLKRIFAVVDPIERTCVEVGTPISDFAVEHYEAPRMKYDKYIKPVSAFFGYNFYYAENEPLFSENVIAESLARAEKLDRMKKEYDEKKKRQSEENKAALLKKYNFLKRPGNRWDYKTVSSNLRALLKHEFPRVKFSVKKRGYHDSVDITWVDGPTEKQVEKVAKLFQGLTFDGMTDYEDFVDSDFIDLFGGLGYIFTKRTYSDEVIEREKKLVLKEYPVLADGNDYKANQEGLYIPGFCVYWVNWRSLVRHRLSSIDLREANETPTPDPTKGTRTNSSSYGDSGISQKKTNESVIRRGKSLQNIIDQTRRLNGYAGRNWFWSFNREKLINKIYTTYVANIQKLGAFSEPEKKFTREEYAGITPTESLGEVVYDQCGDRQLIIGCYPTKEETEKEAKALNGFTDDNGRLKELSKKVI